MQIRKGIVSSVNLAAGTVDVKFPDRLTPGLWLLDSVRLDTLAVNAPVICLFPDKGGEGICLGRHYCKTYKPTGRTSFGQSVDIKGDLQVTGSIKSSNIT